MCLLYLRFSVSMMCICSLYLRGTFIRLLNPHSLFKKLKSSSEALVYFCTSQIYFQYFNMKIVKLPRFNKHLNTMHYKTFCNLRSTACLSNFKGKKIPTVPLTSKYLLLRVQNCRMYSEKNFLVTTI